MFRHQFLVGGTHALSGFQRTLRKRIGRLQSAHHFHDNRHFRIIDDRLKIMNQDLLNRISRKISQIQHIFDVDLVSRFSVDTLMVSIDNLYDS